MDRLLETSDKLIALAKEMLQSCQLKENKVFSYCRFVIAFFFRRSWEMFESFIILLKENRLADAAVLLRSCCDMGINLGYILADDKKKEINSLKYMLEGDLDQLRLITANIQGFKEFDSNIELRRDELKDRIDKLRSILTSKYNETNWDLPSILRRSELSGSSVLREVYNQVYRYYSNIEHHSIFFGQDYVDEHRCEPIENPSEKLNPALFKPEVMLFLFRIFFIEILKAFNEEFQLNWAKRIDEVFKRHEEEYKLIKRPRRLWLKTI